jgi:hypothetical protein
MQESVALETSKLDDPAQIASGRRPIFGPKLSGITALGSLTYIGPVLKSKTRMTYHYPLFVFY